MDSQSRLLSCYKLSDWFTVHTSAKKKAVFRRFMRKLNAFQSLRPKRNILCRNMTQRPEMIVEFENLGELLFDAFALVGCDVIYVHRAQVILIKNVSP